MKPRQKRSADWPALAARVAALLPAAKLSPSVRTWLDQHQPRGVWTVAFSGGADSLALLLLLWAHHPERRDRLVVLHFNHRLRGRESRAEEEFCRQVCARLGVSLRVGQWLGAKPGASEAVSRKARHGFFAREMKRKRSGTLWLAHQQDDVAESMLMRLARGSGAAGLSAPRPVQPAGDGRTYLRPLLGLKKCELVEALKKAGADWCEDSSNSSEAHFRNRIRSKVVPGWIKSSAGRDPLVGAALSRELLEEDDTALEAWAEKLLPTGRSRELDVLALHGHPRAVVRRVLHRWLLAVQPETDLARQGFELLLQAVESGRSTRFSLGSTSFAVIARGKMALKRR